MATLHLLGTGAALSDGSRTTTMLAVEDSSSTLLIDCGGDAIQRAQAHNIALDSIDALLLTHEHPDHVSGFPLLVEKLWLSQRRTALPVYGPEAALDQARRCFGTFNTSSWTDLFAFEWHPLALEQNVSVLNRSNWTVHAAPGSHGSVDVVGFRIENTQTQTTVTYSADTAPSEAIVRLAQNTDVLVHEATAHSDSHSTPVEAAQVAARANAKQLILVHLPPSIGEEDLQAAGEHFDGPAALGHDGDTYSF